MMYRKTASALQNLQKSLQCRKCHQNCKDLLCLGDCEHWFCRSCAESIGGYPCPVCNIPSVASKTRVDLQLSNVASVCSQMINLIDGCPTRNKLSLPMSDEGQQCKVSETEDVLFQTPDSNNLQQDDDSHIKQASQSASGSGKKRQRKSKQERISQEANDFGNDNELDTSQSDMGCRGRKRPALTNGGKRKSDRINKLSEEAQLVCSLSTGIKDKNDDVIGKPKIFDLANEEISSESVGKKSKSPLNNKGKRKKTEDDAVDESVSNGNRSFNKEKLTSTSKATPPSVKKSAANLDSNITSRKDTLQSGKKGQVTNLCKRNAKGETPLQVATIKMDIDEVRRLLDAGANPNVKDNAGWTPLHEAVGHGYTDIASLLIAHGASVNAPGFDNQSPLHEAVMYHYADCVRLLMENGARIFTRNVHGHTPIDLAEKEEIRAMVLNVTRVFSENNVDLPLLDESTKPLCFTGSCLTKTQDKKMQSASRVLHAKIVEGITPEVTHLITSVDEDGSCSRTMKYLSALMTGKWIVDLLWLNACCQNEGHVPESDYCVSGCECYPNSSAPKRALENRLKQLPPLFDGCQMYFYGKFESSSFHKEQLVTLVKQGGAVILKREPHLHNLDDYPYTHPYHAQNSSTLADCTIFVIYDDTCPSPPSVEAQRMSCLPVSWLLDSIAKFSFLEKTSYLNS